MARIAITQAELLDALSTASLEPEDAMTLRELCVEFSLAEARMRRALHALAKQSRLRAHQVTRSALDGRQAKVPAYTILPAKKGKR